MNKSEFVNRIMAAIKAEKCRKDKIARRECGAVAKRAIERVRKGTFK